MIKDGINQSIKHSMIWGGGEQHWLFKYIFIVVPPCIAQAPGQTYALGTGPAGAPEHSYGTAPQKWRRASLAEGFENPECPQLEESTASADLTSVL